MTYANIEPGRRIGRLEVLVKNTNGSGWLCRCKCGNVRSFNNRKLKAGEITECKRCAADRARLA